MLEAQSLKLHRAACPSQHGPTVHSPDVPPVWRSSARFFSCFSWRFSSRLFRPKRLVPCHPRPSLDTTETIWRHKYGLWKHNAAQMWRHQRHYGGWGRPHPGGWGGNQRFGRGNFVRPTPNPSPSPSPPPPPIPVDVYDRLAPNVQKKATKYGRPPSVLTKVRFATTAFGRTRLC